MNLFGKIVRILLLMALLLISGSTGYVLIEDWLFFDGLYMTVITVAGVGYGETHPLSEHGRIFTMILILFGSGILLYSISVITAFVVEGELTNILKGIKMKNAIQTMHGHFILCGESQTGRYVIDELNKCHKQFVVIETDRNKIASLEERRIPYVEGDATTDAVLESAGITRAAGLISTLHSDAENLFVVLTAKGLNPGLRVIAKAVDEASRQKLIKVGADGVVMPNSIGGLRMVAELIRPTLVNFLDQLLRNNDQALRVDEISIAKTSGFIGKTLTETGIVFLPDVTIVALAQSGGYLINPPRDTVILEGTVIVLMGAAKAIDHLRDIAEQPNPNVNPMVAG